MTVDNKTPLLNIPLPDIQNKLSDDVGRIQSALNLIDQLIDSKTSKTELAAAVTAAITDLIDSSPAALDTLNELAAALGDDPNFATTMATQLGLKLDKASYTAADVLAKILTVHGSGSGLDADKLDGMHASAFATAAQGAKADTAVQPAALGTAASKNVPATGNAATAEVVMGNDTRLSDSRPASDVSAWAKAATKPAYTAAEVGAQPSDADLTAIAGLAGTSGLLKKTAADTWALDATAYLPLSGGTMTGDLVLKSDATQAMHPVTWQQLQYYLSGLKPKTSVKAATTANITLSGAQTVDGVALVAGDRVLVKNQTTASQNGLYIVAAGAWTRATDSDTWLELVAALVVVEQGTVNADCGWVCTADQGGTLGTTAVTWTQFFGPGAVTSGTGISVNGTQVSLAALTDSGSGSLLKLTRDAYGRVSGTAAVTAADIKGLSGLFGSVAGAALAATGSAGTSTTPSREDHTHPKPTPSDIGAQAANSNLNSLSGVSGVGLIARATDGSMVARSIAVSSTLSVTNPSGESGNPYISIKYPNTGNYFNGHPIVGSDGVMEIGRFIDFHHSSTSPDYDVRLSTDGADSNNLYLNQFQVCHEANSPSKKSVRLATASVIGAVVYGTYQITARSVYAATLATTVNSPVISNTSLIYYVKAGATVAGTGIPAGTTVSSVTSSGVTLSANATVTGSNSLTFTNAYSALVIDGVTPSVGDRILVKNEVSSRNGIYFVAVQGDASTPWQLTRANDAYSWDALISATTCVEEGVTNAETSWLCTVNRGGTLGTTSVPWQLVSNAKLASLGNATLAVGDTIYASGTTSLTKLAGNTTTTRKFMRQTGTGSASAAPAWDTLTLADLPSWAVGASGTISFTVNGVEISDTGTATTTVFAPNYIGISDASMVSTSFDKWGFACNLFGTSGEALFMGSPGQGWGDGFQAIKGANASVLNSNGLHFSNTVDSSATNTLSWYETGTYTPVLKGSTTAGTFTYSTQLGRYTRIGRMVYIDVNVTVTGASVAPAGNLYITLPKTAISDANKLSQAAAITNNLTITGQAFVQTQSGSVNASVLAVNNGASTAVVSSSDTAFTIQFSLAYVAA